MQSTVTVDWTPNDGRINCVHYYYVRERERVAMGRGPSSEQVRYSPIDDSVHIPHESEHDPEGMRT